VKSFSRAIHINPANTELREDDLMWSAELVHRKASLDRASAAVPINSCVPELDAKPDDDSVEVDNQLTVQHVDNLPTESSAAELSSNYVIIRD